MNLIKFIISLILLLFFSFYVKANIENIIDNIENYTESNFENGVLKIVEIFPKDAALISEYIRIKSFGNFDGNVEFYGLGHGKASKFASISLLSGEELYITDGLNYISSNSKVLFVESINLTDSGELLKLIDNNGVVMDEISYTPDKNFPSIYLKSFQNLNSVIDYYGNPSILLINNIFADSGIIYTGNILFFTGYKDFKIIDYPFECKWLINSEIVLNNSLSINVDNYSGTIFYFEITYYDQLIFSQSIQIEKSQQDNHDDLIEDNNDNNDVDEDNNDNNDVDEDNNDNENIDESNESQEPSDETNDNEEGTAKDNEDSNQDTNDNQDNDSGQDSPNDNFMPFSKLIIEEVYPFDVEVSEYIEIMSIGNYSGNVTIEGLGQGSASKSFNISLLSGEKLIVSDGNVDNILNVKNYLFSSISLTDTGQKLVVYGQDGQVLDSIIYEKIPNGQSAYFSFYSGDIRYFNSSNERTPGYNIIVNDFFKAKYNTKLINICGFDIQSNSYIYSKNSLNLISSFNGKQLENSTNYSCIWNIDGNILSGCNPSYYKFETEGIFNIGLEIYLYDELLCNTKSQFNLPPLPSSQTTSCKETYYYNLYQKWKQSYYTLQTNVKNLGYIVKSDLIQSQDEIGDELLDGNIILQQSRLISGNIFISGIMPNPKGKDYYNELLILYNSGNQVLLNDYYLKYGSRKFILSGTLVQGENILTGNYQFYNKADCVRLFHNQDLLDEFCYPKPKDGELYSNSIKGEMQTNNIDFFSNIELLFSDNQVCITYFGDSLVCKNLKYTKDIIIDYKNQIKNLKSISKKNEKLITKLSKQIEKDKTKYEKILEKEKEKNVKKIDKLNQKIINNNTKFETTKLKLNQKYEKRVLKLKNDIVLLKSKQKDLRIKYSQWKKNHLEKLEITKTNYKTKINNYKNKIIYYTNLTKLQKNYVKNIFQTIKNNWYLVYVDAKLSLYENVFEKNQNKINKGVYNINYYGLDINVYDYQTLLRAELGKIGLFEIVEYKKNKLKSNLKKIFKGISII